MTRHDTQLSRSVTIGRRAIGPEQSCFTILEIGNNHHGSLDEARRLIDAAAMVGADAVKFQTFRAGDIVRPTLLTSEVPEWKVSDRFRFWHEYVQTLELPFEWYDELIAVARARRVAFISTAASV